MASDAIIMSAFDTQRTLAFKKIIEFKVSKVRSKLEIMVTHVSYRLF